jgi:hypothetical protein
LEAVERAPNQIGWSVKLNDYLSDRSPNTLGEKNKNALRCGAFLVFMIKSLHGAVDDSLHRLRSQKIRK